MDSLIMAAARALAAGDPLGALDRIARRDDAPALALRGFAMAQLGDLSRSSTRTALPFWTLDVRDPEEQCVQEGEPCTTETTCCAGFSCHSAREPAESPARWSRRRREHR